MPITFSHRLVLPGDANHHGTLYAGALLRMALEAGYAGAHQHIGVGANLVLKRVLDLQCYLPVPIGSVAEIQSCPLYQTQAYLVLGMVGTPLVGKGRPWMDALMGFVQIDEAGRPTGFPTEQQLEPPPPGEAWTKLNERLPKLLAIK